MKGFFMINVEPGAEQAVHDGIEGIRGVREVVPVYAEHDFIAIADVMGISDMNRMALSIREINGITGIESFLGM